MYISPSLLVPVALFWRGALAESTFSQPPPGGPAGNFQDNPTYHVGEKIDLQWTSNLTTMDLVIWQQYPQKSDNDFYYDYLLQDTRSTSLIWTVTLDGFSTDVGKGEDAIFYLALYESGVTNMDASSHYFNVTLPETTTTSTSATSTATRHAGRPTTSAAEAETTTASSDSGSDDSSLSTGAVAGIAVGATVGGLLLLGAVGFLAWKHFRKGDSGGNYSPGQQYPPPEMSTPGMATPGWIQTPQGSTPVQMPLYMQQQQQQQQVPAVYEAPTDHPKQGPVYEAP